MVIACKYREGRALILRKVVKKQTEPAKSLTTFAVPKEKNMKSNLQLDAKGLSCPMPIVKTKKSDRYISFRGNFRGSSNR